MTSDIANSIKTPISYEGWNTPDGKIWREDEIIEIKAPSLMIYNRVPMYIKSVFLTFINNKKVAKFDLTIPEAYTGEIPERFPWDE